MAFGDSLFFLLVLFGATTPILQTEDRPFDIDANGRATIEINEDRFFEIFGEAHNPSACINITSSAPVEVLFGGCGHYYHLGVHQSKVLSINRSEVDSIMAYKTEQPCQSLMKVLIRSKTEAAKGHLNFYRCTCTVIQHPSFDRLSTEYEEMKECQPEVQTWNDRSQVERFRLKNGRPSRRQVHLVQAIHAAIVNDAKTLCMEYKGDGFVKLVLSRCRNEVERNITLLLNNDVQFGFDDDSKEQLRLMSLEKCSTEEDRWDLLIQPTSDKILEGAVDMYGCDRRISDVPAGISKYLYTPDTETMVSSKDIYLSIPPNSEAVYSADIANMIDMIVHDPRNISELMINVTVSEPITFYLSRCRNGEGADSISISENQTSEKLIMAYDSVLEYAEILLLEKCDQFDADDALYIHVKSGAKGVTGSLKFTVIRIDEQPLHELQSAVVFTIGNDSMISRPFNLEYVIDDAIANRSELLINVKATKRTSLFVSKCRDSKKQLLVGYSEHGFRVLAHQVVKNLAQLMNERCGTRENVRPELGWVHIQGPSMGMLQFLKRVKNEKTGRREISVFEPYGIPVPEIVGSEENQEVEFVVDEKPTVVDIKYYANSAVKIPYYSIYVETETSEPVTVVFRKCVDSPLHEIAVNVTGKTPLTLQEAKRLFFLIKFPPCNYDSKYGISVFTRNSTYQGKIKISLENFRHSVKGNGEEFDIKPSKLNSKRGVYTVEIPMEEKNRSVSIHVHNKEEEPVTVTFSLCTPDFLPQILWNKPLTFANIRIDRERIQALSKMTAACHTGNRNSMFISLRSPTASGRITVDRFDTMCDGYACKEGGTYQFIPNTSGWVIAQ